MKKKKKSFLEAVAELHDPKPSFEDPEDVDTTGQARVLEVTEGLYDASESDEGEDSLAKHARKRGLRHKTDLDDMGNKYAAKVVNRADLAESDESEAQAGTDEDSQSPALVPKIKKGLDSEKMRYKQATQAKQAKQPNKRPRVSFSDTVTVREDPTDDEEEEQDEEQEPNEADIFHGFEDTQQEEILNAMDDIEREDQAIFANKPPTETPLQALHVRNQKVLWDQCVNIRIRLQQPLVLLNRLPQGETLSANEKAGAKLSQLNTMLATIFSQLLTLQKELSKTQQHLPDPNSDAWDYLQRHFQELESQRKTVIEEWNSKTQVAAGSEQAKKSFKVLNQSVNTQIDQALQDEQKLLQRSQPKVGARVADGAFDDNDFYQQLLREVLTASQNDELLGEIDLDLLKSADSARRKDTKQKMDRRASKGRRVRYTVHPKLVNFMAPVPRPNQDRVDTFNELFAGLFGQKRTT